MSIGNPGSLDRFRRRTNAAVRKPVLAVLGLMGLLPWLFAADPVRPPAASPVLRPVSPSLAPVPGRSQSVAIPPATDALGLMFQLVTKLQEYLQAGDLLSLHTEDLVLQAGLGALAQQSKSLSAERRENFQAEVVAFGRHVAALHLAGDLGRLAEATAEMRHVSASFERLLGFFPARVVAGGRAAAESFACPAHPAMHGKRTERCPKCGQALELQLRLLPEFCGLTLSDGPSISATVRLDHALMPGRSVHAFLRLRHVADGTPVLPADLLVAHTERVHLLIVDSSLSDYHHAHPQPAGGPGEYAFSFTPRGAGPYQVWAELRPQPMGLQESIPSLIPGAPGLIGPVDRSLTNIVTVEGFTFELSMPGGPVRFARPNLVRLRITGSDGLPCTRLQPFMNAFAHLVGFYEQGRGVLHVHPRGPAVYQSEARGGPELEFQFYTTQRGFVRLFAQVRIDGCDRLAPFGLQVGP